MSDLSNAAQVAVGSSATCGFIYLLVKMGIEFAYRMWGDAETRNHHAMSEALLKRLDDASMMYERLVERLIARVPTETAKPTEKT